MKTLKEQVEYLEHNIKRYEEYCSGELNKIGPVADTLEMYRSILDTISSKTGRLSSETIDDLAARKLADSDHSLDAAKYATASGVPFMSMDLGDPKGDYSVKETSRLMRESYKAPIVAPKVAVLVLGTDITNYSDDELTEMLIEIESDYELIKTFLIRNEGTQRERDAILEATHYKTVDLQLLRDSADELRRRLHLIE
jgi:hypothetical protein